MLFPVYSHLEAVKRSEAKFIFFREKHLEDGKERKNVASTLQSVNPALNRNEG